MKELIEAIPCQHCDDNVPLDGDKHVWNDHSHAFCPRKLKLVPIEGLTIGNAQQVYSSQWKNLNYVVCEKCGKPMDWHICWLDTDTGGQVHRACLNTPR
jgi:hypothetical protein